MIQNVPVVYVIEGLQNWSLNLIKLNNIPLPAAKDYNNKFKDGKNETQRR